MSKLREDIYPLWQDLERVAEIRQAIATSVKRMATGLIQAESDGETHSGRLGLDPILNDLEPLAHKLDRGVFRLMVLGDMKRGKSTALNALLGENLLPSDVNPCTALLTILRYGTTKSVTVYFNDDRPPEQLDFAAFRQRYTIEPTENKLGDAETTHAFPWVSHAVVDYPLNLLKQGIEIIDSPGLNDTEARNELSLGYIQNCHAVLFVLRATQPCTLAERRYLENYLQDRGITIFFLINAWDQIRESLIDPDDPDEIAEAHQRLNRVFRATLANYCQGDGNDLYDQRAFPVSALQALRQQIKLGAPTEDSGFPAFIQSLTQFLTQERAIAEFRQAQRVAQQSVQQVQEAIARRIPLLEDSLEELQQRIDNVEPEFQQLEQIGATFRSEIQKIGQQQARLIADSFQDFVLGLEKTFEVDFLKYQPANLSFLDFFNQTRRDEFESAFEAAFQQYMTDKMMSWTKSAQKDLETSFQYLATIAERHGQSYQKVSDRMAEILTGNSLEAKINPQGEEMPGWAKWAMGTFAEVTQPLGGDKLALSGFDLNTVMVNLFAAIGVGMLAASVFGVILGPITFALVGLGLGAMQTEQARKQFTKTTRREFVKVLPKLAEDQWQPIYHTVEDCFLNYEIDVMERLNGDIQSRRSELESLLQQKQSREVDNQVELKRLDSLRALLDDELRAIAQCLDNNR